MLALKKPSHTYILGVGILVFIVLKTILLDRFQMPLWDEAVYLTMGKYVLSGGALGYWEALRPPLWPIMLAGIQLLGNPLIIAEIFMNLVAIVGALLLYGILIRHVDRWIATGTALLLLFSDIWFLYSSSLLTHILSVTLVLLAAWAYDRQRPLLSGLAASLAFLTRFDAGIAIAAFGATYAILTAIAWWKNGRPRWDSHTKNVLWYGLGVAMPMGAWMMLNWYTWHAYASVWWHAALRPVILGSANIYSTEGLYDATILYYFRYLAALLPVTILAIWGIIKAKRYPALIPLVVTGIIALLYFTDLKHNEWRFAILMLPGILALAAIGMDQIRQLRWRHAKAAVLILLAANIALVTAIDIGTVDRRSDEQPVIMDLYGFLQERPVAGTVLINDPVAAWYLPNKVEPIYFEHLPRFRALLQQPHDAVVFVPDNFICLEQDVPCQETLTYLVDYLTTNENLVAEQEWVGKNWYIFSDKEWYTPLDATPLRAEFNLSRSVVISNYAYDEMPIVIVMEDFPSINDTKDGIWHEDRFDNALESFAGNNATVALIPTHLEIAAELRPDLPNRLRGFELAQNGYDHSALVGRAQGAELMKGIRAITRIMGEPPTVFIPPYYSADETTANLVSYMGYEAYVSTPGDAVEVSVPRLDQTNSLVLNWQLRQLKNPDDIIEDVRQLERLGSPYALMSYYYFLYGENDLASLNDALRTLDEEYAFRTVAWTADWVDTRKNTSLTIDGNHITVRGPTVDGTTLLFREGGTYSVEADMPLYAKNAAEEELEICIDNRCSSATPDHFFFKRSPIVIPEESPDEE